MPDAPDPRCRPRRRLVDARAFAAEIVGHHGGPDPKRKRIAEEATHRCLECRAHPVMGSFDLVYDHMWAKHAEIPGDTTRSVADEAILEFYEKRIGMVEWAEAVDPKSRCRCSMCHVRGTYQAVKAHLILAHDVDPEDVPHLVVVTMCRKRGTRPGPLTVRLAACPGGSVLEDAEPADAAPPASTARVIGGHYGSPKHGMRRRTDRAWHWKPARLVAV